MSSIFDWVLNTMGALEHLQQFGHKATSPAGFDRSSRVMLTFLTPLAWLLLAVGLVWGLAFAPADYQQKNVYRIIYLHVPSAALSLSVYVMMASAAAIYFIWRIELAALFARASAPYGAMLTALALISGALWGRPTWGTYWTWDARLTSELILLFIYLAYILLQNSFDERHLGDRLAALLAIVGLINIPIIHYSVVWWRSLHQGATIFKFAAPAIAPAMLWPLLISLAAFYLLFFSYVTKEMQNLMLSARINRLMAR